MNYVEASGNPNTRQKNDFIRDIKRVISGTKDVKVYDELRDMVETSLEQSQGEFEDPELQEMLKTELYDTAYGGASYEDIVDVGKKYKNK